MKVAFISDIHSNVLAFNEILEDIKKERPDKIVFLGDYITDGINPNLILDKVREFGDYVLLGNRENYMLEIDESREAYANYKPLVWTYRSLSKENLKYISNLMSEQLIDFAGVKVLIVHGNGYFSQYYSNEEIYSSCDKLMQRYDFDVCVFGHTHVFTDFEYKGKRFINPGSAGMSVDEAYYKYSIIDFEKDNIEVRVKKFKTEKTFEAVRDYLLKSDYYKNNKVWCEINLKMIETGKDYCEIFLKMVNKRMNGNKNMEADQFNKLWEEVFLELTKDKILCKK